MRSFLTSKAMLWLFGLTLAYWLAVLVFPLPTLIDILNGAFLAIALLVTLIYAPLFWRSVGKKQIDRVALLAIAIGALWASAVGARALSTFYRNFGQITEAATNPLVGYFILIAVVAGVLHVIAPGYPPEGVKAAFGGRYRWLVLAALFVGIGAAVAL